MERLPQEIVDKIAEYLPTKHEGKPIRPALATLSRFWQKAIERLTFELLTITSDDLEDFCAANASRRCRFLREINLEIILPQCNHEGLANYETSDDRAATNLVFSHHILTLLHELSQWPAGCTLRLWIDTRISMDFDKQLADDQNEALMGRGRDVFRRQKPHSNICLMGTLPAAVPCVTSFYAGFGTRFLDPGSLVALTSKFPNLEHIVWPPTDHANFLALRRQEIHEFATAVASFQPPSLCKTLSMDILSSWRPNSERLPNLNSAGDSFCGSLCAMLGRSNIQYLAYQGPVDPALFWPQAPHDTGEISPWGSLQEMEIFCELGSLAGQWFFKGSLGSTLYEVDGDIPLPQDATGLLPPGYYDSDEQYEAAAAHITSMEVPTREEGFTLNDIEFRRVPRDEVILPLLAAVARRLANTPSLRDFFLESMLLLQTGPFFFSYQAPGQVSKWDEYVDCGGEEHDDPLSRARVFLHVDDWRPDKEVLDLLCGIGRACHGKDAIITFLPYLY